MVLQYIIETDWTGLFVHIHRPHTASVVLERRLKTVTTYDAYYATASELDNINQFKVWHDNPQSPLFDYNLIQSRLEALKCARFQKDVTTSKLLIRSGLLRNLGNICDSGLFLESHIKTKKVVEEYLLEVVETIQYLSEIGTESLQQKMQLMSDVGQSFGQTALLLQGGATFGLYHLGVIKALWERELLPLVVSGSSVGALIAALVCVHSESDLSEVFEEGGISLAAFGVKKKEGSIRRKITRLLTKGYLLDVQVIEDLVKSNLGDITFEVL